MKRKKLNKLTLGIIVTVIVILVSLIAVLANKNVLVSKQPQPYKLEASVSDVDNYQYFIVGKENTATYTFNKNASGNITGGDFLMGDVDKDGYVTLYDIYLLNQYISNSYTVSIKDNVRYVVINGIEINEKELIAMTDCDKNGKVEMADTLRITGYIGNHYNGYTSINNGSVLQIVNKNGTKSVLSSTNFKVYYGTTNTEQNSTYKIVELINSSVTTQKIMNPLKNGFVTIKTTSNTAPLTIGVTNRIQGIEILGIGQDENRIVGPGTEINIAVKFANGVNIQNTNTLPKLNIYFGEGDSKKEVTSDVQLTQVQGNMVIYTYTVTAGDNGKISISGLDDENGRIYIKSGAGILESLFGNYGDAFPVEADLRYQQEIIGGVIADTTPPKITSVTMKSENTNPNLPQWRANVGSNIVVDIETDEEILNNNTGIAVKIAGQAANAITGSGKKYTANLVLTKEIVESLEKGIIEVEISGYKDNVGNIGKTIKNTDGTMAEALKSLNIILDTEYASISKIEITNIAQGNQYSGYTRFGIGQTLKIRVTFDKQLVKTSEATIALTITFGNGEDIVLTPKSDIVAVPGPLPDDTGYSYIDYEYTLQEKTQNGVLKIKNFDITGLKDLNGNPISKYTSSQLTSILNGSGAILADTIRPDVENVSVVIPEESLRYTYMYKNENSNITYVGLGGVIEIRVKYDEQLYNTDENIKETLKLKIKFDEGEEKLLTPIRVERDYQYSKTTVVYKYTVSKRDNGKLTFASYEGTIIDQAKNTTSLNADLLNNHYENNFAVDTTAPKPMIQNGNLVGSTIYTSYCDFPEVMDVEENKGEIKVRLIKEDTVYYDGLLKDLKLTNLEEGNYRLELTDVVKNRSTTLFVVDNTKPSINIEYKQADNENHTRHVVLTINDINMAYTQDSIKLYKDGVQLPDYQYGASAIFEEGKYKVEAKDYAGNIETKEFTISYVEIENNEGIQNGASINTSTTFTIHTYLPDSEVITKYLYSLDDGATWIDNGAKAIVQLTDEGKYRIKAAVECESGNRYEQLTSNFNLIIDKTAPKAIVNYDITEPTNMKVTASIVAEEALRELPGWTISADNKTLTKQYDTNINEDVVITDLAGNTANVKVIINNINNGDLKITRVGDKQYVKAGDTITLLLKNEKTPFTLDEIKINGKDANIAQIGATYRNEYTVSIVVTEDMPEGNIRVTYKTTSQTGDIESNSILTDAYIIDTTVPRVNSIYVNAPEGKQYYKPGEALQFLVIFNEDISYSEAPILKIKIGNGEEKTTHLVTEQSSTKLIYDYVIEEGENGLVQFVSFNGMLTDIAGNEKDINITTVDEFNPKDITVDSIQPVISNITVIPEGENIYNNGFNYVGKNTKLSITVEVDKELKGTETPILNIKFGEGTTLRNLSNPTMVKQDGKTMLTYTYTVTEGDNGILHIVSLQSGNMTDNAGNEIDIAIPETFKTTNIVADVLNPTTTLVLDDGRKVQLSSEIKYVNSTVKSIMTEDVSGVKSYELYQMRDNNYILVDNYTLTQVITTEGQYKLVMADNVNNSKEFEFFIDITAPVIKLNGGENEGTYLSNVALDITDNFEIAHIYLYKDGKQVDFNYDLQKNIIGYGEYKVVAVDNAGNTTTVEFKINLQAPTITAKVINPSTSEEVGDYASGTWTNQDIKLILTIQGADIASEVAKYQYKLNDGSWIDLQAQDTENKEASIIMNTEGINTIFFRTVYKNGKYSEAVQTTTNIDKTVPTLTITGNSTQWTTEDVILTINASDNGSGIKVITVNGETIQLVEGSYQYAVTQNGDYKIIVTDNAENTKEETVTVSKIEKNAPVITGIEGNRYTETVVDYTTGETKENTEVIYTNKTIIPQMENTDTIASAKLYKNGVLVEDYYMGARIDKEGDYQLVVTNQVGFTTTKYFKIDLTKPEITLNRTKVEEQEKEYLYDEDVAIEATDKNLNDQVKLYQIENGQESQPEYIHPIYKVIEDGSYKVEVSDKAGNTTTIRFMIDKTLLPAPTMTATAGNTTYTNNTWTNQNVTLIPSIEKPANLAKYEYSIDGKTTWQELINGKMIFTQEGTHEIYVRGIKTTGSIGTSSDKLVVKIDKTNPTIDEITPSTTAPVQNLKLIVKATDTASGIASYSWNNGQNWISSNEYTVTANGTYAVKVKDNAGNVSEQGKTITVTNITEPQNPDFKINDYTIKTVENTKYVIGINVNTKIVDFKKHIETNMDYTITDKEGNVLTEEQTISTGIVIKVEDGTQYTLIVAGDLNGDGKINLFDISKYAIIYGKAIDQVSDKTSFLAADFNHDNIINLFDTSSFARILD